MVPRRMAAVCLSIVFTSPVVFAQQRGAPADAPQAPASIIRAHLHRRRQVTFTAPSSAAASLMAVRLSSTPKRGPAPTANGSLSRRSVTKTVRLGVAVQTHRQVFRFDFEQRRTLMETTEMQETLDGGNSRTVEETKIDDINGGSGLTSRRIDEPRSIGPDMRQTDSTWFRRGINGFRESERTIHMERQIEPAVVRRESTYQVRDPNSRWTPFEARTAEIRDTPAERIEEETIQRPDVNGSLAVSERIVTRRSEVNGQEQLVVETYSPDAEGFFRSDSRLALSERVRRSTTATADGGRSMIEEVEARSRVAPGDPMRVVHRTVVTVRNPGPDRQATERQVFERDVNGRLAPVMSETEETAAK